MLVFYIYIFCIHTVCVCVCVLRTLKIYSTSFCWWLVEALWKTLGASLVAQMVKLLPAVWKTWVQSLGWEDPLEKEMATHSSTPAWKIPWTEEPGRLQSMGLQKVGHDWVTSLHFCAQTWLQDFHRGQERADLTSLCTSSFCKIYLWLHWVFVATHGLSLVAASRGYSSLWFVGFSLCVEHRL